MADITLADVERAVKTTATTVLNNEHYFSDLDGLAGDGDFGASLATGFRVIEAESADDRQEQRSARYLLKISMLISKHVGGSSGPIWGTAFMKRRHAVSKGKHLDHAGRPGRTSLGAAIEGIQARGGAKLGDKTLLDALIPITRQLIGAHVRGDERQRRRAEGIATAAAEEATETDPLDSSRIAARQPVHRRAQYRQHPDPGIVAIATILQATWCTEFGVSAHRTVNVAADLSEVRQTNP
jgi:dihydroxyacetone kinase-like protein